MRGGLVVIGATVPHPAGDGNSSRLGGAARERPCLADGRPFVIHILLNIRHPGAGRDPWLSRRDDCCMGPGLRRDDGNGVD